MICILMKYHGHDLQSAVDYVGDLCAKTIDTFSANKEQIPSWGPEIDGMVAGYVKGLQDWIVGYVDPFYLNYVFDILDRSLHWSFRTHRYFGTKGMEVKRHRFIELLPLETETDSEESSPSLPESPRKPELEVSYTPKFSFGEKGALILVSWFTALAPLVPSSIALRVYVYSAFITMTVFILSIIFDLHPSLSSYNFAKI